MKIRIKSIFFWKKYSRFRRFGFRGKNVGNSKKGDEIVKKSKESNSETVYQKKNVYQIECIQTPLLATISHINRLNSISHPLTS
jgi:hypothetical protein